MIYSLTIQGNLIRPIPNGLKSLKFLSVIMFWN